MRKVVAVVVLAVAASGCCAVERRAVEEVKDSQEIILREYSSYVEKDPSLSSDQKEDRSKLVESLRSLTRKLVEALK